LRDSAGLSPDFAALSAAPGLRPGHNGTYSSHQALVKADQLIRCIAFLRPGLTSPGSITLKDSLGGSATIPLTVNTRYS
jgi:hypothetical protein